MRHSATASHRTIGLRWFPPGAPGLSSEMILDAGEAVLRKVRAGESVGRRRRTRSGGTHDAVYRYYPRKAALRDAIAERWLRRLSAPLAVVAGSRSPADERLRKWMVLLTLTKQQMAREDPELFATFQELTFASREVLSLLLRGLRQPS